MFLEILSIPLAVTPSGKARSDISRESFLLSTKSFAVVALFFTVTFAPLLFPLTAKPVLSVSTLTLTVKTFSSPSRPSGQVILICVSPENSACATPVTALSFRM